MEKQFDSTLIYWEKQGIDRLCGLHCVNSILQGPFYNEIQLAQIAIELDSKEKALMMELGTETEEFLKYMAEDSINVSDDGNYSIQVLSEALRRISKLTIDLMSMNNLADDDWTISKVFESENAFICNSLTHWFALRKINGIWFDLNSSYKYPEIMDDSRLMEFLNNCISYGYLLFVVRGEFPVVNKDLFNANGFNKNQIWYKIDYLKELNGYNNLQEENLKIPDEYNLPCISPVIDSISGCIEEEKQANEDNTVSRILESCLLKFRVPDGRFIIKEFSKNNCKLHDLYAFINDNIDTIYHGKYQLISNYPYLIYPNTDQLLSSINIQDGMLIFVKRTHDQ